MRTAFTAEQLGDANLQDCNSALRRCVHCGFCTSTCPTYALDGNELDSPRGRIMLIKGMLEQGGMPDAQTVTHVDRCLSCLSCQAHCPSGVDYRRLIDEAREHIEAHHKRAWSERWLRRALGYVLSRRGLFQILAELGRWVRPAAKILPSALRAPFELMPAKRAKMGEPRQGSVPALGPRRMRVGLLLGCVQDAFAPEITDAAIRVLTKLGAEVVIPEGQGCCGALTHHLGQRAPAQSHAAQIVDAFASEMEGQGLDNIVVTASGCGTMLKDYGHFFRDDPARASRAAALAERAADITEVVGVLVAGSGAGALRAPESLKVAYQSPCSMQHGQKLDALPRQLLEAAGFQVQVPRNAHLCCGSAGVYNLLQPETATRLRDRKAKALAAGAPDVIVSGNIGCMTQLLPALDRPVVHTVQMLDWALGGPRPPGFGQRAERS